MGNICKSCCGGDDGQSEEDDARTRLIPPSRAQPIEPPSGEHQRQNSFLGKKNDEQSALNRILHKAANCVIDVAALDAHGMEPHEFGEKSKAYSQKLASAVVQLRNRSKKKEILPDGSMSIDRLVTLPVLSSTDLELIRNLSANMEESFRMFAVNHQEELIVHFSMT